MTTQIRGAGGGAKKAPAPVVAPQQTVIQQVAAPAYTPVRDPDSLASKQHAIFVDLLSEGEIEGFPSARAYTRGDANYNRALLKDVYLNGTQILRQEADSTAPQSIDYNFQNVTFEARYGTQAQTYIPGFTDIQDEITVNSTVTVPNPVTKTITDSAVDAVRVTITVPRLELYTDQGDIRGTSINLQIQVQYNGGGFSVAVDDTISGRTGDQYQRDYKVALNGTFPVDIRLVRITADSANNQLVNSFVWSSYTEIIEQKLRYPNSAIMALRLDAEQFSNIPTRTYKIRGIKVQLPVNATVDNATGAITYAGVWNGTFGAAQWTSDPAWILYDLLVNTRYGLGDHIKASQLDKFAFFSASQYCGELIDDGFGKTEPRFSCNALIQNQDEAYQLINDLCSVMRVMPYWSTGSLTISQDKPTDASYLFTLANVSEEGFKYSGSDLKTRHTVAVVSYLDMTTQELSYEVVEDSAAIAKYGVITTNVKAFACTSRGQASRLGEWLLYSEAQETEVIDFTASLDAGVIVRPGAVIAVADPVKSGIRRGGRILTATTLTITVDDASANTNLPTSGSATISALMPDGSVETRAITTIVGEVVTVATAFSVAPNPNSIWIIDNSTVQTTTWRVINVSEKDQAQYQVSALAYNASKYSYVERGFKLQTRPTSVLTVAPDPPSSLTATETLYNSNNQAKAKIIVSFGSVAGCKEYRVQYKQGDGNFISLVTSSNEFEILDSQADVYTINIFSISAPGIPSNQASTLQFTAFGKTAVPGDVQGLTIEPISANSARLRWVETVDLDVKVGGKIHIRHSSLTDGTGTWSNSVDLIPAKSGSSTEAIVPLVEGEICVKFEDDGGRQSTNETSVIVDFPDALDPLPIQVRREDADAPPFQGVKTNVFYSDEYDALTLDGADDIDDVVDVDLMPVFDVVGNVLASGSYAFANTLDLGNVFSLDLSRYFVTRGYYPADLIDNRTNDVDDWPDWDGSITDKVNAKLLLRSTNDNPLSSPTWSSYREFVNGTFKGRAFEFKAELTSDAIDQNILIDELGYNASFQRRTEQSATAIASGAAALAVVFTNPFFSGTALIGGVNAYLPSIGITAQNMATGDFFVVTSVSGTGFTVEFKNAAGTAVNRNFNWSAVGFGNAG